MAIWVIYHVDCQRHYFNNAVMDKSKIRKQFGKRIRKLRKDKDVSQEQLALTAGIERSYLGSIERGERSPTLDKIASIAKALKIPIKELF